MLLLLIVSRDVRMFVNIGVMMRKPLTKVYQTAWLMDPDRLPWSTRLVRTFTIQPHRPGMERAAIQRVWRNWSLLIGGWATATLVYLAGYVIALVAITMLAAPLAASTSPDDLPAGSARLGAPSSSALGPSPRPKPSPTRADGDDKGDGNDRDSKPQLELAANHPSQTATDSCTCQTAEPAVPVMVPSMAPAKRPTPRSSTHSPTPIPDPAASKPPGSGPGTSDPGGDNPGDDTSSPADPGDDGGGDEEAPGVDTSALTDDGGQGGGAGISLEADTEPSLSVTLDVTTGD
jgi:hypothetical protein